MSIINSKKNIANKQSYWRIPERTLEKKYLHPKTFTH